MGISVKCRRCNKTSDSEQFVLDPVFKMMVCPNCVKERKSALNKKPESKQEISRPPGWDAEDEYLEKSYKHKSSATVSAREMSDGKVSYKCPNCKYSFIYDPVRKHPGRCPYCSSGIWRIKTY